MLNIDPCHYSHNFILNISHQPARAIDRFSRPILVLSFFFGVLLALLGGICLLNISPENLTNTESGMVQNALISPKFCGILSLCVALGIFYAVFTRFIRRKEITFTGDKFLVTDYRFGQAPHSFEEPLYNYLGVRLRVEFYQFGILTKNKFIIELLHKDPEKTIPLYISMRSRSIRRRWKEYAQFFKMPALKISDKGMVSYNAKNLERPYKTNAEEWHLPKNFFAGWEKPSYIILRTRQTGEKMIKIRKIFFDIYNALATFAIILLGSLMVYALTIKDVVLAHIPFYIFATCLFALVIIIIYSVLTLLSSDIIILAKNKIILFRKTLFVRTCRGIIHIPDIKGIDINYVANLDRYCLAVVSNQETLIFGQKMPVKDLRWLRALLINEFVGN